MLCHKAGMMGPEAQESELQGGQGRGEGQQQRRRRISTSICRHCGRVGHVRTAHGNCLKNPKTLKKAETEAAKVDGKWKVQDMT